MDSEYIINMTSEDIINFKKITEEIKWYESRKQFIECWCRHIVQSLVDRREDAFYCLKHNEDLLYYGFEFVDEQIKVECVVTTPDFSHVVYLLIPENLIGSSYDECKNNILLKVN